MSLSLQGGRSALHYASSSGSDGIVKLLLSKKADASLTAGVRMWKENKYNNPTPPLKCWQVVCI